MSRKRPSLRANGISNRTVRIHVAAVARRAGPRGESVGEGHLGLRGLLVGLTWTSRTPSTPFSCCTRRRVSPGSSSPA